MPAKDLTHLIISQSFQRLLQLDPNDTTALLNGTGSFTSIKVSGSLIVSNTSSFNGPINTTIFPSITTTYDLGTIKNKWRTIYAKTFSGSFLGPITASNITGSVNYLPRFTGNDAIGNSYLKTSGSNSNIITLDNTLLTGNTTVKYQNKNGTLAFLSDISGSVTGSVNYIPKFTKKNTLGNSNIQDNGINILINENTQITGSLNVRYSSVSKFINSSTGKTTIQLNTTGDTLLSGSGILRMHTTASAPTTMSNFGTFYVKSDGFPYYKDVAGNDHRLQYSGSSGGISLVTLKGDVTGSGTGPFSASIAPNKVTYAKIQKIPGNRLLGNSSASSANIGDIQLGSAFKFQGNTLQVASSSIAGSAIKGTISASIVNLLYTGSSTYKTVQDLVNVATSPGLSFGGQLSAIGSKVTVNSGSGLIAVTTANAANTVFFNFASKTFTTPTGSTRYYAVSYNSGSPAVVSSSVSNWNYASQFPLGFSVNESGVNDAVTEPSIIDDAIIKTGRRFRETFPIVADTKDGGLILSSDNANHVIITSGNIWVRLNRFALTSYNSSTSGSFSSYYQNGSGGFTKTTGLTTWDNLHYDNGTGTLATLSANKYANLWFYREVDGDVKMIYGRGSYNTSPSAQTETVPSTLPAIVSLSALLLGRMIFQQGGTNATLVQSALTTQFQPGSVGITSLNGLTADSQTFVNDKNVQISSSISTHTIKWNGALSASRGGTGLLTTTPYAIFAGGKVSTGSFQQLGLGTTGQVLKSSGSSALPVWANIASSIIEYTSSVKPVRTYLNFSSSYFLVNDNATNNSTDVHFSDEIELSIVSTFRYLTNN